MCILILAIHAAAVARAAPVRIEWREARTKHFRVQFVTGKSFAEEVGRQAESHYERIRRDLGFTKRGDFWLWDKRVKLLVYPNVETFTAAASVPAWVLGKANYATREIATYHSCDAFLDSVLPHEIAHLVFRDFVGFEGQVPLWLDEGVAQWEEPERRKTAVRHARLLFSQGRLMPLTKLTGVGPAQLDDHRFAQDFYTQAASLVGFLVEQHGAERFRKLCRKLRDGKTLAGALRFTYPGTIRSIARLERAWIGHLEDPK